MARIDCLNIFSKTFSPSQYGALPYFTTKVHEALLTIGIGSRLWNVDHDNPQPFVHGLLEDPPLCTLSFNNLYANDQGTVIRDSEIYHLNVVVDHVYYFFGQISNPNALLTCVDRTDTEIYRRLGFANIFFLPHATEKIETVVPFDQKKYDVVMLATCIDYEKNREEWKLRYTPEMIQVLDKVVDLLLEQPKTSSYQALIEMLDRHPIKDLVLDNDGLVSILHDLDLYVRGVDRVRLVRSIKQAKVDVFGAGDWKKYLDQPNVTLHEEIPFSEAVEVMKQSKIVLNSSPTIKDGAHERVFTGIAAGALVVNSESLYLREEFPEGAIIFYDLKNLDHIDSAIAEYLKDPSKRHRTMEIGRQIVLHMHTWEQRVKQMVVGVVPLLEKLKKK